VTGATSTNKEFVISSKLIKNSIIALSLLLLIFGFVIFDYLTISFDKEKMKRLESDNTEKEETIEKLTSNIKTLTQSLHKMEVYKDRIMVAAGLQSPFALKEVGSGGDSGGAQVENVISDIELQPAKTPIQEPKPVKRDILKTAEKVSMEAKGIERALRFVESHINEQKAKLASTPALWPTRGYLTDAFGMRTHPITGKRHFHNGLDIATQYGNKVIAPADGFVLVTEYTHILGNLIHIDHSFGFATRYGHLSSFAVKEGDRVKRGQVIGYVGSTGRSTAPHLHYEVIYMGKNQNPMNYIID
jgi:murein DD-endopeptidase MepM/ murein hydrolase activator NlpD